MTSLLYSFHQSQFYDKNLGDYSTSRLKGGYALTVIIRARFNGNSSTYKILYS